MLFIEVGHETFLGKATSGIAHFTISLTKEYQF